MRQRGSPTAPIATNDRSSADGKTLPPERRRLRRLVSGRRRAAHLGIRAKHATIAGPWPEYAVARPAFVEEQAGVRRNRLNGGVTAQRTDDCGGHLVSLDTTLWVDAFARLMLLRSACSALDVDRASLTGRLRAAKMTTMGRATSRQSHRFATWALIVTLASLSPVVCLAGSLASTQDPCAAAMPQGSDSHSEHLDCCISDAPNHTAALAAIATVPPPALTLIAADLFGVAPFASHLDPQPAPDRRALSSPTTPTYLFVSVFRI